MNVAIIPDRGGSKRILQKNILFRCNASPKIGFGHLTRCRALAQALRQKGMNCIMIGPDMAYAVSDDRNTFSDWITVKKWRDGTADAAYLVKITDQTGAQWAVLDDYRIDEPYQLALRQAGLRWMQFDGTAQKPLWADLVLVPNLALCLEDYAGLLRNPNTRVLAGPSYALLRPEFFRENPRRAGRSVEKVLITFGGGDDRGAVEFVLSALIPATPSKLKFTVISGAHNPRNPQLIKWIATHGEEKVHLRINPDNIASLFASCDLAVMAGGTSTYEAACCGLPMILMSIADNQIKHGKAWENCGAGCYLGRFSDVSENILKEIFIDILDDCARRQAMAHAGMNCIDGKGAQRITKILLEI